MGEGSCLRSRGNRRSGVSFAGGGWTLCVLWLSGAASAQTPETTPESLTLAPRLSQIQIPSGHSRLSLNADDCLRRAAVFVRVGDYTRAIESLSRAIALRPDIAHLFRNRGYTYLQIAGAERRVQFYSLRLNSRPESASLYLRRGLAYYNTGEYEKALSDCNAALTRFPDYAAAFLIRALIHDAVQHPAEAAADYARAWALMPLSRPATTSDDNLKLL